MSLSRYLLVIFLGTALSWAALGAIITAVDPTDADSFVLAALFVSIWLSATGTLSLAGLLLRTLFHAKGYLVSRQAAVAMRQAVILASLITLTIFLEGRDLLTWWNALLLAAAAITLEWFAALKT